MPTPRKFKEPMTEVTIIRHPTEIKERVELLAEKLNMEKADVWRLALLEMAEKYLLPHAENKN